MGLCVRALVAAEKQWQQYSPMTGIVPPSARPFAMYVFSRCSIVVLANAMNWEALVKLDPLKLLKDVSYLRGSHTCPFWPTFHASKDLATSVLQLFCWCVSG